MSGSFGIAQLFSGAKYARRKSKISDILGDASSLATPFITNTSNDLKQWGEQDWEHFKNTYRPVAEAQINDANQAPDYNRYGKEVTLQTARGAADANAGNRAEASRTGAGVGSGRYAANSLDIAGATARDQGVGGALANQHAEQVQTNKQMGLLGLGRPDPSSSIAGLGAVVKGGREYGKYSGIIGRQAAGGWGDAGQGLGQAIGSYRGGGTYNSPDRDNSGQPDYGWKSKSDADYFNSQDAEFGNSARYADGGVIRGPGTGRSDSIPAVIDGQRPARVSNGEYRIKADVVARIGKHRLDSLIALSRG